MKIIGRILLTWKKILLQRIIKNRNRSHGSTTQTGRAVKVTTAQSESENESAVKAKPPT
jgi:hypothetical protein